ncbi:hypothetical protein Tco_0972882 [Tanacetum coccineum]
MNHQTSTVPQVIPQVAYQSPQAPTQLMTESPFGDSGFAVLVFSLGDDPIACLNKALAFLTAVASSREMLLVQGEIQQVDKQELLNATTVKVKDIWLGNTEDLDTYDSDCDDLLTVQKRFLWPTFPIMVLMLSQRAGKSKLLQPIASFTQWGPKSKGIPQLKVQMSNSRVQVQDGRVITSSKALIGPTHLRNATLDVRKIVNHVPIHVFEEDGISLIATFIEADLVDVVTIGIPSLSKDDFTKETIRVEYEWRPPRCDTCKIFGHVHDYCPKKVVSPPVVATSNVVTLNAEKTNDGFQTVGKKKKRKGKSKSTNGGQFTGPSVKHNVRYKPKATTSAPKKGTTYVGYTSQSTPMLKTTGNSSKKDNLSMSNSFSALNEEEDDEEDV